ncbi:MAG: hypothetical protein V9G25_06740 [Acidimicrobiia bacterium]
MGDCKNWRIVIFTAERMSVIEQSYSGIAQPADSNGVNMQF